MKNENVCLSSLSETDALLRKYHRDFSTASSFQNKDGQWEMNFFQSQINFWCMNFRYILIEFQE